MAITTAVELIKNISDTFEITDSLDDIIASASSSESSSVSPSSSASVSPSPSLGYADYTCGDENTLPGDDTNLETNYTAGDVTDVETINNVRVDQTGTGEFIIHQFKTFVSENSATITSVGQSTQATSTSTVYLQIYNRDTTTWDAIDSDNTTNINADFTLSGVIAELTNYKDASNIISCRVYQEAV